MRFLTLTAILLGLVFTTPSQAQTAAPADSCNYIDTTVQHQCLFLRAMNANDLDRMRFILGQGYFRINDPVRVSLGLRNFGPTALSYANSAEVYDWLISNGATFDNTSLYNLAIKFGQSTLPDSEVEDRIDVLIAQARAGRFDFASRIHVPPNSGNWFPFMAIVARNCSTPNGALALRLIHEYDRTIARERDSMGADTHFHMASRRCQPLEASKACAGGMPCLPGQRPPL